MRCVIVAAGRGSRLQNLTDDRPKCLVPFMGEPLLSRTLRTLNTAGVTDVTIVGGYRSEALRSILESGPGSWELVINQDWADTNMVHSLMHAAHRLLSEPCLISYSDIFYSEETVRRVIENPAPVRVAYDPDGRSLWEARFADPLSDIEGFSLLPSGNIRSIGGAVTDLEKVEGQYMGLLGTTPEGFGGMISALLTLDRGRGRKVDMTTLLATMLRRGNPIAAVPSFGSWGELDSISDIAFFETRLTAREPATAAASRVTETLLP